jgi:putative heme transporter
MSVPPRPAVGGKTVLAVRSPDQTAPRWLRQAAGVSWRLIIVVFAIALVFYATSRVELLFVSVFLSLVFTAVLRPFVDLMHKVMPRGLATALALLGGVLILAGLVTYVVYSVADQWTDLSAQFSKGIQRIVDWLENGDLPFSVTSDQVVQWLESGKQWLISNAGDLAGQVAAGAGSVVEVFTCLVLALFMTVFFLSRGAQMWTWFLNQLPTGARDTFQVAAGVGWFTFSGYTRGTMLVAMSDGFLAFILLQAVGVPLSAPLAVLVFMGAFIPLIGAPVAMIIAMIVALAAIGPLQAAIVGVGIALIGQFEGHILQPLIMGKQVSLHPVVVALSVTAGTLTAGILGAVVSVPLVAVAWAIFAKVRTLDPPMGSVDGEIVVAEVPGFSNGGAVAGDTPGPGQVPTNLDQPGTSGSPSQVEGS